MTVSKFEYNTFTLGEYPGVNFKYKKVCDDLAEANKGWRKDAKLIAIYDNYIDSEGDSENIIDMHTSNGKVKITDQMGYISSVEDARKKFEELFKINQKPKET